MTSFFNHLVQDVADGIQFFGEAVEAAVQDILEDVDGVWASGGGEGPPASSDVAAAPPQRVDDPKETDDGDDSTSPPCNDNRRCASSSTMLLQTSNQPHASADDHDDADRTRTNKVVPATGGSEQTIPAASGTMVVEKDHQPSVQSAKPKKRKKAQPPLQESLPSEVLRSAAAVTTTINDGAPRCESDMVGTSADLGVGRAGEVEEEVVPPVPFDCAQEPQVLLSPCTAHAAVKPPPSLFESIDPAPRNQPPTDHRARANNDDEDDDWCIVDAPVDA